MYLNAFAAEGASDSSRLTVTLDVFKYNRT